MTEQVGYEEIRFRWRGHRYLVAAQAVYVDLRKTEIGWWTATIATDDDGGRGLYDEGDPLNPRRFPNAADALVAGFREIVTEA